MIQKTHKNMRLKHPYNKIHSRQTYLECPKTTSNKTNTPNDGPKEQLLFATIYATNSRNLCSECPSLIQFTDWEKAKGRGWMEKKAKMSEEKVIHIVTWGVLGTKFGGFDVHDISRKFRLVWGPNGCSFGSPKCAILHSTFSSKIKLKF